MTTIDNSNEYDQSFQGDNDTTVHYEPRAGALPAGTYSARAVSWAWDTDKNGEPCLAVMFAVEGGDHSGYQLDRRLYLDTDKQDAKGRTSFDRSMEALRAMGLQGDLTAEVTGLDANPVEIVTEINANGYAAIKWVNAPRAPRDLRVFAPPAAQQLSGFLAKLNARSRAMSAGARASGSQPVQPQQQPAQRQTPAQRAAGQNATARPAQQGGQSQGNQQRRAQQPQKPAAPPRTFGHAPSDFPADDNDIPF